METSFLQPIYHSLATGRHINEIVVGLLLIAVIFDGYAMVATALAICQWVRRNLHKTETAPDLKHGTERPVS